MTNMKAGEEKTKGQYEAAMEYGEHTSEVT